MHIVFLNQYYPPDEAPTGLMLEAVAESLIDLGHEVTIVCANGGYAGSAPSTDNGYASAPTAKFPRIVRIGATGFGRSSFIGKLADYLTYYLGVACLLAFMRPKPDRIVALTTPPYLSILARIFSAFRGADHAHWIMDLYPDVMTAHGMIRKPSVASGILEGLGRFGFGGSRCSMVLTLGPDMAARTKVYLSDRTPCEWVPLWGTAEQSRAAVDHVVDTKDENRPIVLMYSGNMGLGHRFGEFLEAAANAGPGFRWRFNGDGKRRSEIEAFAARHTEAPIEIGPYVARSGLAAHLASADVHLASLEPSWDGTMVPSKLQGIFAIGRPVLFVGSTTCSMGQWILQSGGGWVVEPGNPSAMREALDEIRDPRIRATKAEAARIYSFWYFSRRFNAGRIAAHLTTS